MEKYGKIIDKNKNGKIWKFSYFFAWFCIKYIYLEKYVSKYCIQSSKNNKKAGNETVSNITFQAD